MKQSSNNVVIKVLRPKLVVVGGVFTLIQEFWDVQIRFCVFGSLQSCSVARVCYPSLPVFSRWSFALCSAVAPQNSVKYSCEQVLRVFQTLAISEVGCPYFDLRSLGYPCLSEAR